MMRSLNRFLQALAIVTVAVLMTACGNGNNNSSPLTVRFVNASQKAALTVALNGANQFSSQAAGSASKYASIASGTYTITITSAGGSLASWTQSTGLGAGGTFTLLAYDRDGAIIATLITEDQTAPTSGYGLVGVSNFSPDSGPLDVYIVAPGTTTLTGLAPTFQAANFSASTVWTTLAAGTFDIVATSTGNPSDVRFKASSVVITGTEIVMLAFTSSPGGALVNGVLMTQSGNAQFAPTANARVRVVSALPVASTALVAATVGGISFASVYSPNPGSYTLVPGGTTSYTISVASTPIATLPAANFTTGGDFTILVYGTVSAPLVSIFTDNNQVPVGSEANLRLVNAAVNVAGGLTLYDNNVQVASSIAYGAASSYFGVAESATSTLEVIEPSVAPVMSTVSLNSPGAVYTVFVIDSTLTPYVIRDR
jgi:hypothetical protein